MLIAPPLKPPNLSTPPPLHHCVVRPPSSLRHSPLNILMRHLNTTALAVHAVLRVDDEVLVPLLVFEVLVDSCGAEALFGAGVGFEGFVGVDY